VLANFASTSDTLVTTPSMFPPISVAIPAFNEAVRIGDTLAVTIDYLERESPDSEVIVVNDGSTDSTGEVIRKVSAVPSVVAVRLLENFPNRGKGAAVRTGLLSATKPIGAFFDADLSTPIDELPKIVEPIARDEVDIAFGSRALNRKLIGNRQPWRREQGGRVFNLVVRLATGLPFWDTQCGFKAFRMESCRPIIETAKIIGFGFDVELLLLAQRAGLRLREVPVRWNHHEGSKIRFVHDSMRMLGEVLSLRANSSATLDKGQHREG
jgi:dolichyl-phosphate beta-glucosyltransferase